MRDRKDKFDSSKASSKKSGHSFNTQTSLLGVERIDVKISQVSCRTIIAFFCSCCKSVHYIISIGQPVWDKWGLLKVLTLQLKYHRLIFLKYQRIGPNYEMFLFHFFADQFWTNVNKFIFNDESALFRRPRWIQFKSRPKWRQTVGLLDLNVIAFKLCWTLYP